jgi:hypothetical protein
MLRIGSLVRHQDGRLKIITRLDNEAIEYRDLNWFERGLRWLLMRGRPEPPPMSRQQTRRAVGQTIKRMKKARKRQYLRWQRRQS